MWDFTYTYNSTISPSRVSLPLYGLQDLFVGHEQVLLTPPCLMGFSLHQCIIHRSLVRHPWEPRVNLARTSMGTPHVYVHGNLASHHYFAPLAIFLCWAFFFFSFFFFSRIFVCEPFRLSLSLLGRDHEHITTFAAHHHGLWYHLLGRKHLEKFPWVINIIYRDTL